MLIRRERPLVMHSSPAWRIASCAVLGGLIIAMAASLGRTVQAEPDTPDKTPTVSGTAVVTVDADDDDDDAPKVLTVDVNGPKVIVVEDDDETETHSTREKDAQKLAKKYAQLVRQSERLQKQMAELQKALEESKAGGEHKAPTSSRERHVKVLKDGALKKFQKFDVIVSDDDAMHSSAKKGEKDSAHRHARTIILKDGKIIDSDGKTVDPESKGVFKFDADGKQFVFAMPEQKDEKSSSDAKGDDKKSKALGLAIKAKKLHKGDKEEEE